MLEWKFLYFTFLHFKFYLPAAAAPKLLLPKLYEFSTPWVQIEVVTTINILP